jgi:uroporphyrinogen decarboxylase
MPVFLETMKRIKRQYSMLRFAVVVGPFTLAAHLRGTQIYLDTATDREMAKRILDYCSETIILYAEALIEAGADFIILAEPTGSQLSPAAYDEFSQVYSRRIMASLSRPCALHVCGKADHIIEKMCESGADAISVDDVNIPRAIRRVPRDMLIIGNLSTLTFATGSPDEVRAETAQLLEAVRDRPEFSIAPGCDLATETPLENIQAFVQATREYG